ncbi:MAG: carboxypeptidase-like regulatory domain-containing protein [Cyclobacteriaceae bacterium]|nr:carboxypeptidase-like regulatory domain-containing protein [Cyclobacteriaceae bacterium]
MKKQFALTVPSPCHEDWNNFTPTQKGKFCGACQKEVIDFTAWTDDEIKQFFKRSSYSTCGRFKQQQLKIYPETITTTKTHSAWAAFVAFLMLLGNETAEAQTSTTIPQEEVVKQTKSKLPFKEGSPITISGVVLDDVDSVGLPGVNIVRKGCTDGTVTDADGRFELTIPNPQPSETLIVSFIGLKTVEVAINPYQHASNLKIVMTQDEEMLLGEIIVGGAVSMRRYSPRGLWWKIKSLFRGY